MTMDYYEISESKGMGTLTVHMVLMTDVGAPFRVGIDMKTIDDCLRPVQKLTSEQAWEWRAGHNDEFDAVPQD